MKRLSEFNRYYVYSFIFILLVFTLYLFEKNNNRLVTSRDQVNHTHDVLFFNYGIRLNLLDMETNLRGYLLTGNHTFSQGYFLAKYQLLRKLNALRIHTKGNRPQLIQLDSLVRAIQTRLSYTQYLFQTVNPQQPGKFKAVDWNSQQSNSVYIVLDSMYNRELTVLLNRKLEYEKNTTESRQLFLMVFCFLLLISVMVLVILKNQKAHNKEAELFNSRQNALSKYTLSLIEASRDPLFTINPAGKITDLNEASVSVTEKTRVEIIGTDFADYFTEPVKAREAYLEVFQLGFISDYPLTLKDGVLTPVLFNGSVYKNESGVVVGAVVVARDITEQKRFETELTEARVYAELATEIAEEAKQNAEQASQTASEAVKAKQQFLSNMSHEIRTPMNAIIGFTKVVLKTDLSAKQREYLTAIKLSGDALIVLINDILDLAKVDAGKMTFEKSPFKLSLSLSAMLHLFEVKIQEKNLQLIRDYDTRIPEVLIGDPVRLHQIVLNLMSNAVKFTNTGSVTFSAKLIEETEKDVNIRFSVIDTGIGISPVKINQIFENFQQASSSTSRLYGGTGLGLAIVKQLVEAQGGTISAESIPDLGSTFSFQLRFLKTQNQVSFVEPEIEMDGEARHIRVLVVEDIALNQLLMKTLLDDFGFKRDIAANGKIAVEKLEENTYDIVLMDLQMPVMNGFEATSYIRNVLKLDVPIIALTADVTTVDLAKCMAVGMNDYLAKPVDERSLYSKIVGLVNKNEKGQDLVQTKQVNTPIKLACINLDYLHHRTKSNPLLLIELISLYLEQTPIIIKAMKDSLIDENWELLSESVHKLIPSFAIMGIDKRYADLAISLQNFAQAPKNIPQMNEFADQLESVCLQACYELTIELEAIKLTNQ